MDQDIVDEIRKDRESGAKRLESEYKVGLMAFARRFCADEAEAEALVYRTFSEVIANIDGYTEKSAFFGWMCKILINCHANDIRRRSNKDIEHVESVPEMPEDGVTRVVEAIDANILREAVERLPLDMKEAVLLRYFMDLPILKVAQILAQPVGTVKSRLYYARLAIGMRLGVALKISLLSVVISIVLGIVVGLLMTWKNPISRALMRCYLEIVRIMPQKVLLFLVYFGTTRIFGWNLSGETSSVIVFSFWGAAEMGDLVRGALISIPQHQYESAAALGLSGGQTYRYIVLP